MELSFLFVLLGAYLVGAIPTGVILTRLAGHGDVRQAGSGNIGATNVYRVAGRGLGLLTLFGDALKGVAPLLLTIYLLQPHPWQVGAVAVAAFVGHCFPVYLGFKGGKGVATALGIFLVLSPLSVLAAMIVFALLLWKWRYVSLGSVAAALLIPFLVMFFEGSVPLFVATLAISTLVIVRHRANIQRLLAGAENRFNF